MKLPEEHSLHIAHRAIESVTLDKETARKR